MAGNRRKTEEREEKIVKALAENKGDDFIAIGKAKLKNLPLNRIPQPAPLPKGSHFPEISPALLFTSRDEQLLQLATWLKKGTRPVVITQATGSEKFGGAGKTWLAREFARRYGKYFSGGVFWYNFSDPELIPFEIVAGHDLASGGILEARARQVQIEWESELPRLLIFDGCENAEALETWRPHKGGSRVLLTSRRNEWGLEAEIDVLSLSPFERRFSLELLQGYCTEKAANDPALEAIAENLGDQPQALALAGNMLGLCGRKKITPEKYLQVLQDPDLLKRRFLDKSKKILQAQDLQFGRAVKLSLEHLNTENKTDQFSLDLLSWMSWFAADVPIPPEWLGSIAGEQQVHFKTFEAALESLVDMGLVQKNDHSQALLHERVAYFVKEFIPGDKGLDHVENFLFGLAMEANRGKPPVDPLLLLHHLKFITDHVIDRKKDELAARLSNELAYMLEQASDLSGAQYYYEHALTIQYRKLGQIHADTAICLTNLGHLHDQLGDLETARLYYDEALDTRKKLLGKEHPDTARSLNNMGFVLQRQLKFAEARQYFEQALQVRRKVFGENHLDTAASLSNLGGLSIEEGQDNQALVYFEQALQIRQKILGEEHPETAKTHNSLGSLLQKMGEFNQAKSHLELALAIRRKSLGEEHVDTACTLSNLGELMLAMGDFPRARNYLKQALAIQHALFGEESLEAAETLSEIGVVRQLMGNYPAAQPCYEQALAIRSKMLGEENALTALSLNQLGALLKAKGTPAEAQAYFDRSLAIRNALHLQEQASAPKQVSRRSRIAVTSLFAFSFLIFAWNIVTPGPSPITLNWNSGKINLLQPLGLFSRRTDTPTRSFTSTFTPTNTTTSTFTSTRTFRVLKPTNTFTAMELLPTSTATVRIILPTIAFSPTEEPPTQQPTPRVTLLPTDTLYPTFTPTPRISPLPTDTLIPTNTPTPRFTALPSDTPLPPTP